MNEFSLQKPRARNYIHEWIYHELMKKEGLVTIDYKFINLKINGDDQGLYVMEESFGKNLLERNKRRNGPIFSLDEDVTFNYIGGLFQVYDKKFWTEDENNLEITQQALNNLQNFFKNERDLEDTFDIEKWAKFFAVADLLYAYHGVVSKSVKLYYNTITGLFEPIPYDGHRDRNIPNFSKFILDYDNEILLKKLIIKKLLKNFYG